MSAKEEREEKPREQETNRKKNMREVNRAEGRKSEIELQTDE